MDILLIIELVSFKIKMPQIVKIKDFTRNSNSAVYFTKPELNQLLSYYSQRVISGEWKDYAIDHNNRMSSFSIYRDTGALPLFTISKYAKGTHQQGDYAINTRGNMIKRGKHLTDVLSIFNQRLKLVSR
ncbi:MAG: hypothetical protein CMM53_01700 [Rhodospirillaceae bacterium]|nr:hypothetical protein [Rhodospirillaceae bacterium]